MTNSALWIQVHCSRFNSFFEGLYFHVKANRVMSGWGDRVRRQEVEVIAVGSNLKCSRMHIRVPWGRISNNNYRPPLLSNTASLGIQMEVTGEPTHPHPPLAFHANRYCSTKTHNLHSIHRCWTFVVFFWNTSCALLAHVEAYSIFSCWFFVSVCKVPVWHLAERYACAAWHYDSLDISDLNVAHAVLHHNMSTEIHKS